ncbi:MAG: sigma-70 family RNA polymerase sigma factor [Bacteroidetes bacterium]|jgi:RNA polymerase sigma-70 factor (ECF subfamily)|nr:sigma-70 family RNA polymerase sigma factor [Bacteroidota bacterium]
MAAYSDKELLDQFRNGGNPNYAFHLIVRKYQERLYWHIRKMVISHEDTDDLLQETFVKAWQALPKFREESNLFTWLYRIATNESLGFLRRKKRKQMLSLMDAENQLNNQIESDPYFDGDEIQQKLQKALLKLPDKQRLVFNMKYFEEMKYEDMARILETSTGSLKASYHHAIKKIEKYLDSD